MTTLVPTTAFALIRRLAAAGLETPSLYLLIAKSGEARAIQADIVAEVQVQLGIDVRILDPSKFADSLNPKGSIALIVVDTWSPKLAAAMDRNIVLLTRPSAVLLLTSPEVAARILAAAPNLRSRLTDALDILPDVAFGGIPA